MNRATQSERSSGAARGRLLIVATAVLWSTSGLFAKAPLLDNLPVDNEALLPVRGSLLTFFRALFAGLILLPWIRRPQWSWSLAPAAGIFAVMNITIVTALTLTTAANAVWLQATAPMWVFLVGVVALHERMVRRDLALFLFCTAGVATILWFEIGAARASNGAVSGVALGLISGVCYAGVILSLRRLRDFDPVWLIALFHLVAAAVLAPWIVWQGVWPSWSQTAWLAAFGIVQMGVPYVLFARGVRAIAGHEAAFIALLEPLLVPAWVFLAWRHTAAYQAPAWGTLLGGGLILVGLASRYVGLSPSQSPANPAED